MCVCYLYNILPLGKCAKFPVSKHIFSYYIYLKYDISRSIDNNT